jgi:uroporphyrin-III C-methyltransferase/precorrin-2 dehydrogenase/sirohydrochlorin ferrochelatase
VHMESLPIFMRIKGARCVVVGGGEVATRKVAMLLKADAAVEVISPEICDALKEQVLAGEIRHIQATFDASQLAGATLVIAATDDEAVNTVVSDAAKAQNIPVNVVDAPALCTFTMPSIVDRSPVVIAISSNGAAPVLARLIRAKLETMIPASYGPVSYTHLRAHETG